MLKSFRSVGLETLGLFGSSATELFDSIASRIRAKTGHARARTRLYRQIAIPLSSLGQPSTTYSYLGILVMLIFLLFS